MSFLVQAQRDKPGKYPDYDSLNVTPPKELLVTSLNPEEPDELVTGIKVVEGKVCIFTAAGVYAEFQP